MLLLSQSNTVPIIGTLIVAKMISKRRRSDALWSLKLILGVWMNCHQKIRIVYKYRNFLDHYGTCFCSFGYLFIYAAVV